MSKGHLPQSEGLEMEKHRNIPQTSPLPRSGQTKIAGPGISSTLTVPVCSC